LLKNESLGSTTTQHTINDLTPGRLYNVTVVTEAGGLQNSKTIEARTAPSAVSNITSENNGTSLRLSWQQPEGHVDAFIVTFSNNNTFLQITTQSGDATEVEAHQLTPGSAYQVEVMSVSGTLTNQSEITVRTAPAAVVDLHIRHSDETSLSAMWNHAPSGSRDGYFLTIRHDDATVDTREVEPNMRECTFNVLTPGRWYIITVTTRSGKLNTSVSVEGRTGVSTNPILIVVVQNHSVPAGSASLVLTGLTPGTLYRLQAATVSGDLQSKSISLEAQTGESTSTVVTRFILAPAAVSKVKVANGGRSDALYVSWLPAEGVVDSYLLHLEDGKRTVHMLAVSSSSPPECSFSSLEAGRLYSVVIVTRSSGLKNTTVVYWHHAAGDLDRYVVLISYNHTILQNQSVPTGHNECTFSSLMPGRLYTVTVETWSGSYVSSVSTHGRTRESELKERNLAACGVGFFSPMVCFSVPAAVRNLSVRNTGTADLNVTWSPALGDVDHYEGGVSIDTRPVPKHISSLGFLDLIPGQVYTVTIQSQSGTLSNSNAVSGRTAPATVTALQADNGHTTHSLTVRWERPVGVYDGYSLQLLDEAGGILRNQSVVVDSQSELLEGLTAGKWYRVKMVTLSSGVPSLDAATAEGQTRPAAVQNLTVVLVNTTSLSFSWRPSDGHVDTYDLSLYHVSEATTNHRASGNRKEHQQTAGELVDRQKVGPTGNGCVFSGLQAGSLYRLLVVSWSRDMSSDSSVQSSGQTNRLTVSWQHGEGSWSSYQVLLYDASGATLGAETLGAEHRSHTFLGLIPGRLYHADVITHSGDLVNNVSEFGRTSPEPPTHLSVRQGPTNDTIELLWSGPASGDYDNFSLQWAPEDHLSIIPTHLTSCIVGGMFPGRNYNFTLMTVSGGGAKGDPTAKSQPIQRSVRTSRRS
ncbi:hypothetical protein GOODEAATRI_019088, partial [Goodea atripinnis]